MKQPKLYYGILAGAFIWCALLFVPPLTAYYSSGNSETANIYYSCYARICHQYDSHSLHILGYKLAVCARCSSIYFGFFLGILLAPFGLLKSRFSSRFYLMLALFPMLLDVALDIFGIAGSTTLTRIMTGLWFGILTGQLLTPLLLDGFSKIFQSTLHNSRNIYESQT